MDAAAIVIHDSSSSGEDGGGGEDGFGRRAPASSAYQEAVRRALAMAASLTARDGDDDDDDGAAARKPKKRPKPQAKAVRVAAAEAGGGGGGARKRPLAKSSRPWVAKSAVMASETPRHATSSSTSSNRSTTASSFSNSGYSNSRRSRGALPAAAADRTSAGGGAARRVDGRGSLYSSANRSSGITLLPSQTKLSRVTKLQNGLHQHQHQYQHRPDLIEISSSSSSSGEGDGKRSSSSVDSSQSDSSVKSSRSGQQWPRDRKVRRVLGRDSVARRRMGDPKSAEERKRDAVGHHSTAYHKQSVVSAKPADKQRHALQSASSFRPREQGQDAAQPPRHLPLPPARPILAKKKATRKSTVLNLSPDSRARTDSLSSLSVSSDEAVSRLAHHAKKRVLTQQQQRRRQQRVVDSDGSVSSLSDGESPTRYYCRKSAPASTSSAAMFRHRGAPSPPSPPQRLPPPLLPARQQKPPTRSPPLSSCDENVSSSKRQRRQPAARFHVDSVALDEVQAQERELARFEREMRQLGSSLVASSVVPKPAVSKKPNAAAWPETRTSTRDESTDARRGSFFDDDSSSDVQVVESNAAQSLPRATRKFALNRQQEEDAPRPASQQHGKQQSYHATVVPQTHRSTPLGPHVQLSAQVGRKSDTTSGQAKWQQRGHLTKNATRATQFLQRLDSGRFVIHPTAYRGVRVAIPPATVMHEESVECLPAFQFDCDVPLSAYGEWCFLSTCMRVGVSVGSLVWLTEWRHGARLARFVLTCAQTRPTSSSTSVGG